MSFLDFLQDIAIILFFCGSKITNKIGASGAILLCIYAVFSIFQYF